jgi:phospholipid transport system substrate-binding protein
MTSICLRRLIPLCLLLPVLVNAESLGTESPNAIVQEAVDILDTALTERRDELASSDEALYGLVDEILLPRFDRRYAAQLVLGKHWRSASPEQRDDFVNEFYASLLRRYADGLLKFDQTSIEMLPYRGDETKKHTKVKTIVTLGDGTKVPVDYALVSRESGWLIIDVIIEGISYLQTTKKELSSEIRTSSLDEIIERLKLENTRETGNG